MRDKNTDRASHNRTISRLAAVIMIIFAVGSFACVWMLYYTEYAFRTFKISGGIVTILIYSIIYLKTASVYRGFKIASFPIMETAFSQCLAIGLADLAAYVQCCLIYRNYVSIIPGLLTVAVQFFLAFVWAYCTKKYFLSHVQPQKSILIYDVSKLGTNTEKLFVKKLQSRYGHLFYIDKRIPADEIKELKAELDMYPVVFLFEIKGEIRDKILEYCIETDKKVYMTPCVEDVILQGFRVKNLIDTPLYAYESDYRNRRTYPAKRLLDIIVSLFMIIISSPVMLITAACIKLEDRGDVFFKQERCTKDGEVFNIIKFRSMVMDAEKDGKPRLYFAGDDRITKVGRIIRKTRIDELPQLFNVLSGKMSLVGPRPERPEFVELYTKELPEFRYRLRVKAGLTGYAQVYGKYNTGAYDKLLLDLLYIENQSLLLDIRIAFLTIKTIFSPEASEGFSEKNDNAVSNGEKTDNAVDINEKNDNTADNNEKTD